MKEKSVPGSRIAGYLAELREEIPHLEKAVEDFKCLDESMKELRIMMTSFAEKAREGIVLVQDHKVVWVNKAAGNIVGYLGMELIGMSMREVVLPDQRDKAEALTDMLVAGIIIEQPQEWTLLRKDRTTRNVKSFGYQVQFKKRPAIVIFFYDVTEENQLRDELQMRALLLDSVTDSVFLLDTKGKIVYLNEAAYATRGYTKEELLNRNVLDITPKELKRKFDIRVSQFSEHRGAKFDTVHICKDGSRMKVEVHGKAIKIGKKSYLLGVAREKHNITEFVVDDSK